MTTELVLLLAIYGSVLMGVFLDRDYGAVTTFKKNLPKLSARVEAHVATGRGFWTGTVWRKH